MTRRIPQPEHRGYFSKEPKRKPRGTVSVWQPQGVLSLSPWRVRTWVAFLSVYICTPLIYINFIMYMLGYITSHGAIALTTFVFSLWNVAAPFGVWTYEVSNNPYIFAPSMKNRASPEEEEELLQSNRNFAFWSWEHGFSLSSDEFPLRLGFRDGGEKAAPDTGCL